MLFLEINLYDCDFYLEINRNIKSLRSYADKYKPTTIFRVSPRNLTQSGDFVNIPLYATSLLLNLFIE
jgi:hypothetical protein